MMVTVKHERNREYTQASLLTLLGNCIGLWEVPDPTVSCSLAREADPVTLHSTDGGETALLCRSAITRIGRWDS